MSAQREKYKRRGLDHYRHARMANPDLSPAGDLGARHVLRQDTVVFLPDSSSSTASLSSSSPSATPDDFPFNFTPIVISSTSSTLDQTSTLPTDLSSSSSLTSTTPTSSSTSSSSSSSLSSSTSSSTILSTTSVPLVTPVVRSSTSIAQVTQYTYVPPSSSTVHSATPSASTAPASGTSTSAIVGGIAAGLVGLAGLIFATMFFVRRWRKRGEEEAEFDADAFRRQSAILVDDEHSPFSNGRGNGRGYNPRPPTMIERHIAGRTPFDPPPMPRLQQYNNTGAGGYGNEYDYPAQASFSPGQVMPSAMSPPPTQTGMQFFAPYGQSPLTSPTSYDSAYNEHGQLVRQPSNGAAIRSEQNQQLSRQLSHAGYSDMSPRNSAGGGGDAHYVDLARSSVSPFQAAQYAEISRQLNVDAPAGLNILDENEEHIIQATGQAISPEGNHPNRGSPFADPQSPSASALEYPSALAHGRHAEELVPPSPIYSMNPTKASRDRIVSYPPKLPEIQVQERTFSPTSYDFPQTPSAIPSPSPLATNFTIPGPHAGERFPNGLAPAFATLIPGETQTIMEASEKSEMSPKPRAQRPVSTYTVYDEDDAYGGF